MIVIDAQTVIDFKPINPNAKRHQAKLSRDLRANLSTSPGSQGMDHLSRSQGDAGLAFVFCIVVFSNY